MHFVLLALFASCLAGNFLTTATYSVPNCQADGPVLYTASPTALPPASCAVLGTCTTIANGWSQMSACSETTNIPSNAYGWQVFNTQGCSGEPTAVVAYGNGCFSLKPFSNISTSFSLSCNDGTMNYKYYQNSENCQGNPTAASGTYPYGCFSVQSGGQWISTNQLNCPGGTKNYYVYLQGWLNYIGQNWVVANFDASKQPCYSGHGSWTVTGNTVTVNVNINQCSDTQIDAFVNVVCKDLSSAANAGACANADCGNVQPVSAVCDWSFHTKRDANQGNSIILSSTYSAPGAASSLVFPLLALMLSVLALLI